MSVLIRLNLGKKLSVHVFHIVNLLMQVSDHLAELFVALSLLDQKFF